MINESPHVTIENPSSTAALRLFTQRLDREGPAEIEYSWCATDVRAYLAPRSNERLQLEPGRRYVLAVADAAVVAVSGTHKMRITELTLDADGDWSEKAAQPAAEFKLSAKHRIALKIGDADDREAAAYVTHRSGDPVQILREEVGRASVEPKAVTWGAPVDAGVVPVGSKKTVLLSDTVRAVVESVVEMELGFFNANKYRALQIKTRGANGESNFAVLPPAQQGVTATRTVTIGAGLAAIIEQVPT